MKRQMYIGLLASVLTLTGCSNTGTIVPGEAQHTNQTFEAFADSYAHPNDTGDGAIYKFSGFDKVLGKTYHVSVRHSRFRMWCSANGYKTAENGDTALGTRLRKLYPSEVITETSVCGDGKGGFYGYAYFDDRQKTAFLKAGVLNPKIIVDFWPEKGNPQDFWETGKAPTDMWPEAAKK